MWRASKSDIDCSSRNFYFVYISYLLKHVLVFGLDIGVNAEWLDQILNKHSPNSSVYKTMLIDKLLQIINMSSQPSK